MYYDTNVDNTLFFTIEFVLVWIIAFIGAMAHEVMFNHSNDISLRNKNLSIVATVDFLICYAIDPYIIPIHPRLILLPPLILGLLGNELILRLSTIKGSTSFLEYILGFLGVTNKNESREFGLKDETPTNSNLINEENQEDKKDNTPEIASNDKFEEKIVNNLNSKEMMDDINERCRYILNRMENLLLEYYSNEMKNITPIIDSYDDIKLFNRTLTKLINQNDYITINITFKVAEIIKKESELDYIYRSYMQTKNSTLS